MTVAGDGRVPRVGVEFYGLARLRAGRKELDVGAATLGEALAAADAGCPKLRALSEGRVSATYLVSVNGEQFTTDTRLALQGGDAVLIFGADAGG
jgi:molybdopterin converting factor small subunit